LDLRVLLAQLVLKVLLVL
jgi:hypothetical protein